MDPAIRALREAALGGAPFQLDAIHVGQVFGDGYIGTGPWYGDRAAFTVRLEPWDFVTPATFWESEGKPVTPPFVETYRGTVEGETDGAVVLVLTGQWVRGSLRIGDEPYLVRVGFSEADPNVLPGSAAAALTPRIKADAPRLHDPPGWEERALARFGSEPTADAAPGDCPGNLEQWAPITVSPEADVGPSALAPLPSRLIMDGDAELVRLLGDDTMPMLVALAAETDLVYQHEVAIHHTLAGVHVHTDPSFTRAPDTEVPLAALARYWGERHRERDVVHLVTGYDSSFAQANCISGAGLPDAAFTFTPYPWDIDGANTHGNVMAHELGHIYSAHHHYGNHAEGPLATIMIQGYTPGTRPVFGTLERAVIRGWAEANVG